MRKASSRKVLLDVNVFLAVAWPHHPFHNLARNRLEGHTGQWATCALTELGFLRLSLNPAIVTLRLAPAAPAIVRQLADPTGRPGWRRAVPEAAVFRQISCHLSRP